MESGKYHNDYAISKYGVEIWRGQQEGLEVIVNPRNSWTRLESKEADNFTKVKKWIEILYGFHRFVAVTDVVRMAHELMESEIKNERFTLIAEIVFFVTF
jgi:hypothetical protein